MAGGRPPGQLGPPKKSGGRQKGSMDRAKRQVVTDQMSQNILDVFNGLGGLAWMLDWAKENPRDFMSICLSRLFPAYQKENPDVQINQQFNGLDAGTDLDAARRVAFLLAKAAHDLDNPTELLGEYAYTPEQAYDREIPASEPETRPDLIGDMQREPAAPDELLYSIRKHS